MEKFGANPISEFLHFQALLRRRDSGVACQKEGSGKALGIMRVHLSLGDTVYVSDENDHGIIEQFVPYGKLIVRLVRKGKVLKLNRGDVKKSRRAEAAEL